MVFAYSRIFLCLASLTAIFFGCEDDQSGQSDNTQTNTTNEDAEVSPQAVTHPDAFEADGSCVEHVLFTPQAVGDEYDEGGGSDMYRGLYLDEETGDLYLSTYSDFFRYSPGDDAPVRISDFPGTLNGRFWVNDNWFIFPAGMNVPMVDSSEAVLLLMPRDGGDMEPRIFVEETDNPLYESIGIHDVTVDGDNVYWVQSQRKTNGADLLDFEIQYTVMKSTLDVTAMSPETVEELYAAPIEQRISNGTLAAGSYWVEQEITVDDVPEYSYLQLDATTGEILSNDTIADVGGMVDYGDHDWLLLRTEFNWEESSAGNQILRTNLDGSEQYELEANTLVFGGLAIRDELWAWVDWGVHDHNVSDDFYLWIHEPGGEKQFLGCINKASTTTHGITIAEDAVYVSISRNNMSSILKYDL